MGDTLHLASLAAFGICILAYIWGYVFRRAQLRVFSVISFFATIVALGHVALMLGPQGANGVSLRYAAIFLCISGLGQATSALQTRKRLVAERRVHDFGPPSGTPERRLGARRA